MFYCNFNLPVSGAYSKICAVFTRFFLLLSLLFSHMADSMAIPSVSISAQPTLALFDTQINRQPVGEARYLSFPDGVLYLHEADLVSFRLRRPDAPPYVYDGQTWFPLSDMAGVNFKVNEAKQTIQVNLSAQAFVPNALADEANTYVPPTVSSWGGFVNYDLLASGANGIQQLNGMLDANIFAPYGTLNSSFVGQNLWSQTRQPRSYIRQNTVWSYDRPGEMISIQVGDTQGRGGLWGRPVSYGGLRWSRNFAMQPGFVTTAVPILAGEAVLPSTVDLYIDGVAQKRMNIPPGPFSLSDFPQMSGQGEAKLVVRDSLGREQIIIAPYAATDALLKSGVFDYSVEVGAIRQNYGLVSNDYGHIMAAVTLRKGWSDRLTVEGRSELLREQQTLGVGGSVLTVLGVATASVASSRHNTRGSGNLFTFSLDKQKAKMNFGIRGQSSSANFVQIGGTAGAVNEFRTFSANLGWQVASGHSLGASLVQRKSLNQSVNRVASINYSTQIGKGFSLNASLLATLSEPKNNSIMFFLTKAINDRGGVAMFSANAQKGGFEQPTLQVSQAAWQNGELGYRAQWTGGKNQRQEAGVTLRSQKANYTADASRALATTNYRLGIQGGLAMLKGRAFATQQIKESFGLVRIPGYPNIEVSSNGLPTVKTNADGDALLPDLYAYRNNVVAINPLVLPLDAQLASSNITVVPYQRSGVPIVFDIKRSRSVVLTLMLQDGKPAPVGMSVRVGGVTETFTVGLRGEVFVTDLGDTNKFQAEWHGKTCQFDYVMPTNANTTIYAEPMVCTGVIR